MVKKKDETDRMRIGCLEKILEELKR